ncbi:MAG TPA: LacI family DNA-binding transcriptional regulator [Capsulimonadaceae bacterium]|jgi:LacI family transcriptional regulator
MSEIAKTTQLRKRSTVRDVAALAGVHHASVSVALNSAKSGTGLSAATRERILEAARLLDYRPNSAAKMVQSGKFNCIGLVMGTNTSRSAISPEALYGINMALTGHGYHLTIATLADEDLTDSETLPKILKERMLDGLIINYTTNAPAQLRELVSRHSIPSVWINSVAETDCVYPDDLGASRKVTERLIAVGHRRIEYWGYDFEGETAIHYSSRHRRQGYLDAMASAGLTAKTGDIHVERHATQYKAIVRDMLVSADRPSAVVTYWPSVANAIFTIANELGIRVPVDLEIATFSDIWQKNEGLPIITCQIPTFQYGQQAVEMLIERMKNPAHPLPSRAIDFDMDGPLVGPAHSFYR